MACFRANAVALTKGPSSSVGANRPAALSVPLLAASGIRMGHYGGEFNPGLLQESPLSLSDANSDPSIPVSM